MSRWTFTARFTKHLNISWKPDLSEKVFLFKTYIFLSFMAFPNVSKKLINKTYWLDLTPATRKTLQSKNFYVVSVSYHNVMSKVVWKLLWTFIVGIWFSLISFSPYSGYSGSKTICKLGWSSKWTRIYFSFLEKRFPFCIAVRHEPMARW